MNRPNEPQRSVLETIGKTPLVEIDLDCESIDVFAKIETFNPGGSVKDRIGKYILEQLIDRGEISPGGTIVEPTAGNTGIGMAIAARQLDLHPIFVVPTGFSEEKEELMAALGAEIVNTPGEGGMNSAIEKAEELANEREAAVVPQQFSNELNVEAHYETTGQEIIHTLDGEVGAVVIGIGSGGTVTGVGKAIREVTPDVKIFGVEPQGSTFGELFGRDPEEEPYKTEGIGTHQPELADLIDPELVDDIISVADRDAHAEVKRLAAEEGHLVGSSAGAASVAAKRIATQVETGDIQVPHDTVVTVFPDGSDRYLSKNIYGSFDEWEGKS